MMMCFMFKDPLTEFSIIKAFQISWYILSIVSIVSIALGILILLGVLARLHKHTQDEPQEVRHIVERFWFFEEDE